MLGRATGFSAMAYIKEVYVPVIFKVTLAAVALPSALSLILPGGLWGFAASVAACVVSVLLAVLAFCMTADEREWLKGMIFRRNAA
jgi:hypothetical protein